MAFCNYDYGMPDISLKFPGFMIEVRFFTMLVF